MCVVMTKDFVIRIGGEAGRGIATGADIISNLFLKLGYHVFSSKDYCSQIKGGHNYHTIRISSSPIGADVQKVDMLLALDAETIRRHEKMVGKEGIILYEDQMVLEEEHQKDPRFIAIKLSELKKELQNENIHNALFLGAAIKALGLNFNLLKEEIELQFKHKSELKEQLLLAAQKSFESAETRKKFDSLPKKNSLQLVDGNQAVCLGALKAGLSFHVQYPMTPVSGILHYLAKESLTYKNLQVFQMEDEIAVINMALGASYAGARAMVATSGGGFALMVESVGLAGMAEIPLVIIEGQRPGPATGVPTKTEQGDLKFTLSAGTGSFPLVLIAPGDQEESYTETKRAFYLAEKYQLPVIILTDKHLSESLKTVDLNTEEKNFTFDYNPRINILSSVEEKNLNSNGLFKRYEKDNLLRTLPGTEKGYYTCAGDEHDEVGSITEDSHTRIKMMQRRMGKLDLIRKELPSPKIIGPEEADLTVVSWGSNKGAIMEAVEKLNQETNKKINILMIKYICPFQKEEILKILNRSKKLVLIEANYPGELGEMIREQTGIEIKNKILRYDGTTFSVNEIQAELKRLL